MKLSEAMMLGSTTVKMVQFDIRSCALGAAANALGIPTPGQTGNRHLRGLLIAEKWPWITDRYTTRNPWSTYGSHIAQEFNAKVCGGYMSFEALVDHVRSIEPECGECNRFECICVRVQEDTEELAPKDTESEGARSTGKMIPDSAFQPQETFDPAAMEDLARGMLLNGTMPSREKLEAALDAIREEFGPKILKARQEDQETSSEAPPSLELRATSDGTFGEQQTTGKPTRRAGCTFHGLAKPDDPVYQEGWTITLGGLRGQSRRTSASPPASKPESQDQHGDS